MESSREPSSTTTTSTERVWASALSIAPAIHGPALKHGITTLTEGGFISAARAPRPYAARGCRKTAHHPTPRRVDPARPVRSRQGQDGLAMPPTAQMFRLRPARAADHETIRPVAPETLFWGGSSARANGAQGCCGARTFPARLSG